MGSRIGQQCADAQAATGDPRLAKLENVVFARGVPADQLSSPEDGYPEQQHAENRHDPGAPGPCHVPRLDHHPLRCSDD